MGRRGPIPKPSNLERLHGHPGKRHRSQQPAAGVPEELPRCPEWLDAAAIAKWNALLPELGRLKLLTLVDGDALAAYCQAWAEFKQATETLQAEGRYVTMAESGYVMSHPAVSQQRSAWQTMKAFAALLGLDPISRSRLRGPEQSEQDPFEEFLRRGKRKEG